MWSRVSWKCTHLRLQRGTQLLQALPLSRFCIHQLAQRVILQSKRGGALRAQSGQEAAATFPGQLHAHSLLVRPTSLHSIPPPTLLFTTSSCLERMERWLLSWLSSSCSRSQAASNSWRGRRTAMHTVAGCLMYRWHARGL